MMKTLISLFAISIITVPALAAPAGRGRPSMASQMIVSAPRATASVNQISGGTVDKSSVRVDANSTVGTDTTTPTEPQEPVKPNRDKERAACLNNNIGVGNTFVWASRFSNVASYHSMIEDIEEPENNTCFVRVDMRSNDSRINVNDIPFKYFEMGTPVTCGSWANEETMRQRILDAKKTARVWGVIGASVGGAGLGVGIMELFGNKLIGGAVEGQKREDISQSQLLRSQLLTLKDKDPNSYKNFMDKIAELVRECDKVTDTTVAECNNIENYKSVLAMKDLKVTK